MAKQDEKIKIGFFRSIVMAFLIAIAGAILLSGNMLFWAGNTIVNNDQFIKTTAPLIKNSEIQTAVAKYGTEQLFTNVDVQGYITKVLPPKAEFLAPTLTTQLKDDVNKGLQKSLAKPKVQTIWNKSLEKTHNLIIKGATNYKGNGTLDLGQLFTFMTNNLKDTKLAFLSEKSLPKNIGQIKLINAAWLPVVHNIVVNIKPFEAIMTLVFIILVCVVIIIAKNKRRIITKIGFLFSSLMLLTIVILRILSLYTENQISSDYQKAAIAAYQIVLKPFYIQTAILLVSFLTITIIAWLSDNSKSATKIKYILNNIISGKLHILIFGKKENKLTTYVGNNKKYIIWTIIILTTALLCVVKINLSIIIDYIIAALILILTVNILAANK